jgi:hypothetical protein
MGEGNRTRSFIILFFISTLAFSLTSAGILKGTMAISMDAYATKSEGSSGGGSSDGGGGSKGSDGGSGSSDGGSKGSDGGSGSSDGGSKGSDGGSGSSDGGSSSSSDKSSDNGGVTGGENNPTIEEPNTPPPPIDEPNPTLIAPPPPPPPPPPSTCEQGSTSPECANVPEPTGPVDCSTAPNDPSCKSTEPIPPVDCTTTPDDPSCKTTPEPADCKTTPDDPSCTPKPVDCTTTPDDPSCKVDCTKNPDDPSCNVCQPAAIGISCPPPECPKGQHFDDNQNQCVPDPTCSPGQHYDPNQKKCIQDNCPNDQHFDPKVNKCVPNPICKNDGRYDAIQNKCICPDGTKLINGKCQEIINITIVVHKVVKNSFSTSKPTFLLLLDTAQLCQLAGDTQCVAKQNQFDTLNLVTKLDSTGKTWTITGQVENRVSKTQNNVQVTGYFYDSRGNSVGGPYKGTVSPTSLKSHQLGAFSMKPSTSIMKGTPSFMRLEYQSNTAP